MKLYNEVKAALTLMRLPGVGAAAFKGYINQFGSACAALMHAEQLHRGRNFKRPFSDRFLKEYLDRGHSILVYGQQDYPPTLMNLPEPPPLLFVEGNAMTLQVPMVAIIGPRAPSAIDWTHWIHQLIALIRCHSVCTISGGAIGIDAMVHQRSLGLSMDTVAVLAHGTDVSYPKTHKTLFDEIKQHGALVSEFLPQTSPRKSFFITRNRIIAGLATWVIAIDTHCESGSWTTVHYAEQSRRHTLIIPRNSSKLAQENTDHITLTTDLESACAWLEAKLRSASLPQVQSKQPDSP